MENYYSLSSTQWFLCRTPTTFSQGELLSLCPSLSIVSLQGCFSPQLSPLMVHRTHGDLIPSHIFITVHVPSALRALFLWNALLDDELPMAIAVNYHHHPCLNYGILYTPGLSSLSFTCLESAVAKIKIHISLT